MTSYGILVGVFLEIDLDGSGPDVVGGIAFGRRQIVHIGYSGVRILDIGYVPSMRFFL